MGDGSDRAFVTAEHECVSVPGDASSSRLAREWVSSRLEGLADRQVIDDMRLVASELCANAVQHVAAATIDVRVDISNPRWWILAVTSHTGGPEPPPVSSWKIAVASAPAGRGLGIVRRLSDRLTVEHGEQSFVVTCWRSRDRHAEGTSRFEV